jgi:hypothetical protein
LNRSPLIGLGWLILAVWLAITSGAIAVPLPDWFPGGIITPSTGPGNLRVLFLVEESEKFKLTTGQRSAIDSLAIRNYLSAKATKDPDGKTAGWRVWDDDYDDAQLSLAPAPWAPIYKQAVTERTGTPWLFVANSTGTKVYSAPIPETATEESVLAILKNYGGN